MYVIVIFKIENGNGECVKKTKTRPKSRKQPNIILYITKEEAINDNNDKNISLINILNMHHYQ